MIFMYFIVINKEFFIQNKLNQKMDHHQFRQLSHNNSMPFLKQEKYVVVQHVQPSQRLIP